MSIEIMTYQPQQHVRSMMDLFGQTCPTKPTVPDRQTLQLRARLIYEEAKEFIAAAGCVIENDVVLTDLEIEPDLVEMADAIGDILVVTYGAANALGVDAESIFNEVHRSNLTKLWDGPNGPEVRKREDGKVIKPPTYSPADIKGELVRQSAVSIT